MDPGHAVTGEFEEQLCMYTGAPYVVGVDCGTSALYLAIRHEVARIAYPPQVHIPARTFRSVPVILRECGCDVVFQPVIGTTLRGAYRLNPLLVWDCALRFTWGMYQPGTLMCLSFTGHRKRLRLGRGGAILTDDAKAAAWFSKARWGHHGCRPCWMPPMIAALGVQLMRGCWDAEWKPLDFEDIENEYPDLRELPE